MQQLMPTAQVAILSIVPDIRTCFPDQFSWSSSALGCIDIHTSTSPGICVPVIVNTTLCVFQ